MLPGYNTNGLAFHRWEEGLELLAEIGYQSVALTLDHACLDPYAPSLHSEIARMRAVLQRLRLRCVVETGARFLLNPRVKHDPTLVSATPHERAIRLEFLRRAIQIAAALEADAVSFWSGTLRDPATDDTAFARLAEGCRALVEIAQRDSIPLAFEPEPGMFIDTLARFRRLADEVRSPLFGLTLDLGHVHCVEDEPIAEHVRAWGGALRNIHIEDMVRGVHEHLRFGEGEIDFPPVFAALREVGYTGGIHVELSRHSHMAPDVARESFQCLTEWIGGTAP